MLLYAEYPLYYMYFPYLVGAETMERVASGPCRVASNNQIK